MALMLQQISTLICALYFFNKFGLYGTMYLLSIGYQIFFVSFPTFIFFFPVKPPLSGGLLWYVGYPSSDDVVYIENSLGKCALQR